MRPRSTLNNNISVILLLLLAWAMVFSLPAGAQEESTSVNVNIHQTGVVADLSLERAVSIHFNGTVTITTTGVATVYLDVEVPAGWDGTISPESATTASERTIEFDGVANVPRDEDGGEFDVRVKATVEIAGEYPARWASDTMKVEVVTNRVAVEVLEPAIVEVEQANVTQSRVFNFRVRNLGTTPDMLSVEWGDKVQELRNLGWHFWKDQDGVDLEPRSSFIVTLEVTVPANAGEGEYTITLTAESGETGDTESATATVKVVKGHIVGTPGKSWELFGFGLTFWFMIVLGCMALGMAIFITGTEVGFFGFLIYILVPLYCRIKREKVLDNFLRGQIYGYIKANPGTHYMEIQHELDIKNGVLAHHLKVLEREKYIKIFRDGLYKRFYPMHAKVKKKGKHLSRIQKDIVEAIGNHPGINQRLLSKYLEESKQVINYHVKILLKANVIRLEREGNLTKLYLPKAEKAEEEEEDEEPAMEVEPIEITAIQRY